MSQSSTTPRSLDYWNRRMVSKERLTIFRPKAAVSVAMLHKTIGLPRKVTIILSLTSNNNKTRRKSPNIRIKLSLLVSKTIKLLFIQTRQKKYRKNKSLTITQNSFHSMAKASTSINTINLNNWFVKEDYVTVRKRKTKKRDMKKICKVGTSVKEACKKKRTGHKVWKLMSRKSHWSKIQNLSTNFHMKMKVWLTR